MKKYKVYNIDWDCDDDEETLSTLPGVMIVEDKNDLDNENYELSDFISNAITEITGFCHFGCDYEEFKPLTRDDIINLISKMENDEIVDIYAVENEGMPDLAMGVEKHQVFDGLYVFLCNVYGSFIDFQCFPMEDTDMISEKELYGMIADYFIEKAKAMCKDLQYLSNIRIY